MSFTNLSDLFSNVSQMHEEIKKINTSIEKIETNYLNSNVGSIHYYVGEVAPRGFLFCDGSSLDRKAYANLFSVIGTNFGNIDNNSFNIPNLGSSFSESSEIKFIIRY